MKYSILWRLYLLIGFHGDYLSIELHHLSIQVICIYSTRRSLAVSLSFQTRSNAIVSQSLLPLKGDGRKQLFFLPSEKVHCSLSLAHIRLRMERRKFVSIKNEKKKGEMHVLCIAAKSDPGISHNFYLRRLRTFWKVSIQLGKYWFLFVRSACMAYIHVIFSKWNFE